MIACNYSTSATTMTVTDIATTPASKFVLFYFVVSVVPAIAVLANLSSKLILSSSSFPSLLFDYCLSLSLSLSLSLASMKTLLW
jgi:hypothetical protein